MPKPSRITFTPPRKGKVWSKDPFRPEGPTPRQRPGGLAWRECEIRYETNARYMVSIPPPVGYKCLPYLTTVRKSQVCFDDDTLNQDEPQ